MLAAATFYKKSPTAKAAQATRAAQQDARKASDALAAILGGETGKELKEFKDGDVDHRTSRALEAATDTLNSLKMRIQRHAVLIGRVAELDAALTKSEGGKAEEIDAGIVHANMERVMILSDRDAIARDILLARRQLETLAGDSEEPEQNEGTDELQSGKPENLEQHAATRASITSIESIESVESEDIAN